MDYAILFWILGRVSSGEICNSASSIFMYAICASQSGSVHAAVGHELFHRRNLFDKIIGTLSYAKLFYGHNFLSHIKCHHKRVSTPEDPQSAKMGESVFEY
jgi:alkane 1-monooxygenase